MSDPQVSAWRDKRPGMELKVNVLRRAQLPDWLQPQQKQEPAGVEGAGAATPLLEGSVTPPPLPLADGPTASGAAAAAAAAANGSMKRSASGGAVAAAGGGEGQAAKRARTDEVGRERGPHGARGTSCMDSALQRCGAPSGGLNIAAAACVDNTLRCLYSSYGRVPRTPYFADSRRAALLLLQPQLQTGG